MVRCQICGAHDADALCIRCGKVVCERCFDGFKESCHNCVTRVELKVSQGVSITGLRMMGFLFVAVGLLLISLAFTQGNSGVIIIFPFLIGNIEGWPALALVLASITLFMVISFIPWVIFSKRNYDSEYRRMVLEVGNPVHENTDYIITVDIPTHLRNNIFIEEDEDSIRLKSSVDEDFTRSYPLPDGLEVSEYSYEYQENYLLIKLNLKRVSEY